MRPHLPVLLAVAIVCLLAVAAADPMPTAEQLGNVQAYRKHGPGDKHDGHPYYGKQHTGPGPYEYPPHGSPEYTETPKHNYGYDYEPKVGPVGPTGPPGQTGPPGPTGERGPPGHAYCPENKCCDDKCGLCPSGTAANFWELGRPSLSAGIGNFIFSFGDEYPFVSANTDCGTDLQVGGACETFCVYHNTFVTGPFFGSFQIGSFFAAHAALNGWAAEGAKAGTRCALSTFYEFYFNLDYFFFCAALPWKLCCRPPGYTPYIWPNPGFGAGRSSAAATTPALPVVPGQISPLPDQIVEDVLAHKANPNRYKDKSTTVKTTPADLPAWVLQMLAAKFPGKV